MPVATCEMKETDIDQIMHTAEECVQQSKLWHFHMLTPDCMFNKQDGKHAFVLEDCTDKITYVAYSDTRYMEQGKQLVQKLHGDSIVEAVASNNPPANQSMVAILQRARDLNAKEIHWHHHMLFPNCIYNPHPEKWCIVFEDKETGRLIEATYEQEPSADLRAIEVEYYAQKG